MSTATPTVVDALRGRLIVSCQAYPGEPMRHPETMAQIAKAAIAGGAAGIRAQGLADLALIAERLPDTPLIGLWKVGTEGVFITPTLRHARAVRDAGAGIVAVDGTRRPRPDGLTLARTVAALHGESTGDDAPPVLVMADCGSLDDALAAADAGADLIGTTLAGYTGDRPGTDGPDLELIALIAARLPGVPLVAEGRIHTPAQAAAAREAGADTVVVGTAITHPTTITGWFAAAL
ncbi:putative N-acetylmannosamine-6-phosphate 2-epimerase [Tersicoccus solisilvae]|uniref:Putative N-acetylmannosamine-6-phosphate 2-epimerase n=1 Tax=Tersicoccus solisilvae TaxID=1882339 RepID=A0ABQ1NQ37_9MICC|nr:putative N-acetylmannosamine-6-phosphate 2-epimerase [Tersicoccus solisilvae]GGC82147.1 putative N-acetylmannosamine-6-phosphate 2-epimerase [Tersicoccus solisilvae]